MIKKLFQLLISIVIIAAAICYIPQLVHKCDHCNKWFFGTGYESNIISKLIEEDDLKICRDCAEKEHSITSFVGKPLDDYKIPFEFNPIALIEKN